MSDDERLEEWRLHNNALTEWRDFLENTPAYTDRRIENLRRDSTPQLTSTSWVITLPRIYLHCEIDDGVRSFESSTKQISAGQAKWEFIQYTCRDCGRWIKTFAVFLPGPKEKEPKTVVATKAGEFPPFGSHVAKRLQNVLKEGDLAIYRKGLRSEREGQGIGAAAYFRRVVEHQWRTLVSKLRDAAERLGTDKDRLKVFDDALEQTQFSQAVDMLKDAIPAKLLILDGKNPLTLLYRPLSAQIHDLTDEQCLQQAADIRTVLNELFDNIDRVLKDDEALKGAVNRLGG